MASVVTGKNEIFAKQIEVKATGASDVKIYAGGANQKVSGVDVTDNSVNKNAEKKADCKPVSIFNPEKKEKLFGNFDINENGKLDKEELVAMKAYVEALMKKQIQKPEKIDKSYKPDKADKPDKQNKDMLIFLLLFLITQLLEQESKNITQTAKVKKDFLEVA